MSICRPEPKYCAVAQRQWGMTSRTSEFPVLKTPQVAQCVAMIVHSPKFEIAALAHLDAAIKQEDIDRMWKQIRAVYPSKSWTVIFVGGYEEYESVSNANKVVRAMTDRWKDDPAYTINTEYYLKKKSPEIYNKVKVDALNGLFWVDDFDWFKYFKYPCSGMAITEALNKKIGKDPTIPFTLAVNKTTSSPLLHVTNLLFPKGQLHWIRGLADRHLLTLS